MSVDPVSLILAIAVGLFAIAGAAVLLVGLVLFAGCLLLVLLAALAELGHALARRVRARRKPADQDATAISPNE